MTYRTRPGAYPEIQVNVLRELPRARYLLALERMRERIAGGLRLEFEDSTTTGNKYTHCSWGLCSEERAAWPDAEDHIWPQQFEREGRVAPLDIPSPGCPMDRREGKDDGNGCFYTCRVFNPLERGKRPSQEQTLELYDIKIKTNREKK